MGTYLGSIVVLDSSYYLTGLTVDFSPVKHNVGLFLKLDLNGNKVLQRTYGDSQKTLEMWKNGLTYSKDGFFLKTGTNRDRSIFLIKLAPNGNLKFVNSYSSNSPSNRLHAWGGLAPTHDNGWLISATEIQGFDYSLVLIKTDSNGNEVSRWVYDDPIFNYEGSQLLPESDGGFIVSAFRSKGDFTIDPAYRAQTHIFKIDSLGKVIWNYYTSTARRRLACASTTRASDGGLILAGTELLQKIDPLNGIISYLPRGYLRKINSSQQFLWERELGVEGYSDFSKVILKNGDLYAFGRNLSPDSTFRGAWMVKMDETWGIIDFERVIGNDIVPSVPKYRYLIDVAPTPDNGFIFCGYIDLVCQTGDSCHQWSWVVKLDSMGCVVPGCHTVGIEDEITEKYPVRVFPSPAQDRISFQWDTRKYFQSLAIYDTWGKQVAYAEIDSGSSAYELQLTGFSPGVYIYRLKTKDGEELSGKFVKH